MLLNWSPWSFQISYTSARQWGLYQTSIQGGRSPVSRRFGAELCNAEGGLAHPQTPPHPTPLPQNTHDDSTFGIGALREN